MSDKFSRRITTTTGVLILGIEAGNRDYTTGDDSGADLFPAGRVDYELVRVPAAKASAAAKI